MSRSILAGPLLLLLYQTAPITVAPDSSGVFRVSVGYGAGSYHSRVEQMSCETGEVTNVSTIDGAWSARTAEVEAWPAGPLRATVVATQQRGSGVAERWTAGALVAGEWRRVGVGAGFLRADGDSRFTTPLVYFRAGDLDARHFRLDVAVPDPPASDRAWLQVAAGHNLGRRPGARWVAGVAVNWPHIGDDGPRSAFADVFVPLGQGAAPLELRLSGRLGTGEIYHPSIGADGTYTSWAFQAGLRYTFGH